MIIAYPHSLQWMILLSMTIQHTRNKEDIKKKLSNLFHVYKFLSRQSCKDIDPQRNMYTQSRYLKSIEKDIQNEVMTIPIRFFLKAWTKGSNILLYIDELQQPTHPIHYNYHQGKRRKLEYMEKGNKYHKEKSTSKISLLHMREVEEKIGNKIARLTYLGLVDHMHDFV